MQTFFTQPTRYAVGDAPGEVVKTTWNIIDGTRIAFNVAEKSLVRIGGHVGFQHSGPNGSFVMIGLNVLLNAASIPGFERTVNLDRARHYEDLTVDGFVIVEPGDYIVDFMAIKKHSGTDSYPVNIKAPQFCGLFVTVEPCVS